MRISDWSSDVCSSDLSIEHVIHTHADKPESQYSCTATIEPARWPARVAGRCPTLKTTRCRTPPGCRRRPCRLHRDATKRWTFRSEEHTSELQSLMRISYAVFCLKKKKKNANIYTHTTQ